MLGFTHLPINNMPKACPYNHRRFFRDLYILLLLLDFCQFKAIRSKPVFAFRHHGICHGAVFKAVFFSLNADIDHRGGGSAFEITVATR